MLRLDWFVSSDETHVFGKWNTYNLGKTECCQPWTMLACGGGTSVVKDVEEHPMAHPTVAGKCSLGLGWTVCLEGRGTRLRP